jgi:hypothetical protein
MKAEVARSQLGMEAVRCAHGTHEQGQHACYLMQLSQFFFSTLESKICYLMQFSQDRLTPRAPSPPRLPPSSIHPRWRQELLPPPR